MSIQVQVVSWKEGLNKVQLNHLLRSHGHLGLAAAKNMVDDLLDGKRIAIDCDSIESASTFVEQATQIGAVCESVDNTSSG